MVFVIKIQFDNMDHLLWNDGHVKEESVSIWRKQLKFLAMKHRLLLA